MAPISRKESTINYAIDHLIDNGVVRYQDVNSNVIRQLNDMYDRSFKKDGFVSAAALAESFQKHNH